MESSIRKLTATSLRLNALLAIAVSLAVLLLGTCYWAIDRLIQEEREKLEFHFSRLIGDIHEHEEFLVRAVRQSDLATQSLDHELIPFQKKLLQRSSHVSLYEAREFSFAMPFTLALPTTELEESDSIFALGVMMANFYSTYWATSHYPATQVLVLNLNGPISMAVPSIDTFRGHVPLSRKSYLSVIERVRARIQIEPPIKGADQVVWGRAERYSGVGLELLAYIATEIPDKLWRNSDNRSGVVVACLLDLGRINDFALMLDHAIFDEIELVSPSGKVLVDSTANADGLKNGVNITRQGLIFKFSSAPEKGWTAFYRVRYGSFFFYAKWQLLVIGTTFLISIVGSFLAFRGYSRRVVAPAKQAHSLLVESDTFSRTIIQTVPLALCVLRNHPPYVVMENQLAQAWLGDGELIATLSKEWFSNAQGEGRDCYLVFNDRHYHVTFNPTRYKGESVLLCTLSDVTAHKEAEEALAEAKRSADAANEAKTVFLATMSHEIRTPLSGVLGTLELLGLTSLSSRQREYLKIIQHSSSILLQLISDILDISKIESDQMVLAPVEFCPLDLVEDVVRIYAGVAIAKGLQIYCCVDSDVPGKVFGDASRIRQILNNLLSNAIKFTDIGRVVLRLHVLEHVDGMVNLEWQVTDTGIGIAQEKQSRLFEPFYQVHGQQHTISGTGLGLSICWRLSKMMGGALRVVSDAGLGSSFTLLLQLESLENQLPNTQDIQLKNEAVLVRAPVKELALSIGSWLNRWGANSISDTQRLDCDSEHMVLVDLRSESLPCIEWAGAHVLCTPDALAQPQMLDGSWHVSLYSVRGIARAVALAQGLSLSQEILSIESLERPKLGLRVLVAEDNPINQVLLKEQLEELGCSVMLCSNGLEALQLWQPRAFDVLVTDVNMPLMNGYELAKAVRQEDPSIPIIGVTANAMREEGERCMAVGMNHWIVKPMSLLNLHEGLCKVCSFPGAGAEPFSKVPATGHGQHGSIKVSEKMRDLFVQTMQADIQSARTSLQQGDGASVQQLLHRMRGALVVVQAHVLADACGDIEEQIAMRSLDSALAASAQKLLDEIADVLNAL